MINISIVLYHAPHIQVQFLIDTLTVNPHLNKIYLIDNSSTETTDFKGDHIRYIFVGKNVGFGAGHNIAIRESLKDQVAYHLVINYDLKIDAAIIDRLIKEMDEDKSIGIIMPKVLNEDHTVQLSPKLLPTPTYVLFSAFKPLRKIFKNVYEDYTMKNHLDRTWNLPIITGCFSLFRVSVLSEIGLYDERFFMYFEDDDLSRRIHSRYKTVYFPEVVIEHSHQRGATKSLKLFVIFGISAIRYFNKWGWVFDKERHRINEDILKVAKMKADGKTSSMS
ncbi:MAG TPA: glycosyltransferase family 2 protein [Bacteroidales bacterium]|nr:glycosyltransferase family 2 protein [Bacteroidales bacterium]